MKLIDPIASQKSTMTLHICKLLDKISLESQVALSELKPAHVPVISS